MASLLTSALGYHTGSVLPRIPGARTAKGMRVIVDRTGTGELWTIACVLALLAVAVVLVVQDVVARAARNLGTDIQLVLLAVAVMTFVAQVRRRRRFRKGTLLVNPWPLRLGSTATADLHAFVRNETAAPAARLECVEQAISGRNTRYEQKNVATIYAIDLPAGTKQWKGTTLHASWQFSIPATTPPSFSVRGKAVVWRIVTTIATDAGETSAEFELLVIPEVAA